jgi:hypothetical protein
MSRVLPLSEGHVSETPGVLSLSVSASTEPIKAWQKAGNPVVERGPGFLREDTKNVYIINHITIHCLIKVNPSCRRP